MRIHLSGIAAKELGKSEYEYSGKLSKKELISFILNAKPSLRNIQLEMAVNSVRVEAEDIDFSKKDEILIFNAYAGG